MKASELIEALQKLIEEHGDLETLCPDNGGVVDVNSVRYLQDYSLPPVFVIS